MTSTPHAGVQAGHVLDGRHHVLVDLRLDPAGHVQRGLVEVEALAVADPAAGEGAGEVGHAGRRQQQPHAHHQAPRHTTLCKLLRKKEKHSINQWHFFRCHL